MGNKYDVIVVGAGNGGLVSAAMTAKAGLKTLLLEKHNIPGGCATSFRRGRFEFEPSLHELCSVGTAENPDIIYRIFDSLGAKVDWRYENNPFRAIVKGPNGYDVTMPGGIENFCKALDKAAPGSYESCKAFFALVPKIKDAIAYIYAMKGHPNGLTMITKHGDFMKVCSHTVEEVMIALGMNEKARNIINTYWGYLGVPTDEISCMHFLNMVYGYVVDGAAMPAKRSHEMSSALIKVLQDNGGEVRYNSEVTKFLYDESTKAICGVVAGGEELFAKEIISNVIPNNVYNRSEAKFVPEHNLKVANARDFGISVATIYLGLDCPMEDLKIKDYTVFIMNNPNPRIQNDDRLNMSLYIVNCLNAVIPESSPKGTCTMFFTIPIYGSDLPKDLTPATYKKYKNEVARKYIEDYEKLMGVDLKSHIEEISIATPVTFARYLGTPEGTIYGYRTSGWDGVMARTAAQAKDNEIEGLSFVGGHGFRGDGYSCAYITGETAANRVIKKLGGKK